VTVKKLLIIREAATEDVEEIFRLLELYSPQGIVLPRSREDITFFISNFTVAICDGKLCGCVAVRDFGNDLLEVRSLVVSPEYQGSGIGRAMIASIIEKLKVSRKDWRLFALTLQVDFFCKIGFREVPKSLFPEKIWSDCSRCEKRHCCDETAMLMEAEDI